MSFIGDAYRGVLRIIYSIIHGIDKWLNPYKYYYDEEELGDLLSRPSLKDELKDITPQEMVEQGILGVRIEEVNHVLTTDEIVDQVVGLDYDHLLYVHTDGRHQLAGIFEKESYGRYQHRDDKVRKTLKPLLFPKSDGPFDRTHVIPIGYHGSENDSRLVIGWNKEHNRKDIRDFESQVRDLNDGRSIIWFADIQLNEDQTATWNAYIYDRNGKELLTDSWTDYDQFVWKDV